MDSRRSSSSSTSSYHTKLPVLTGALPGQLDATQPARLLRHPNARLVFASNDHRTASGAFSTTLSSLHIADDPSPKRIVIEVFPSGESYWRFVPRAEGVDDAGEWPRPVDICGVMFLCSQEQWEIYKLDPAYRCVVPFAPNHPTISPITPRPQPPPTPPSAPEVKAEPVENRSATRPRATVETDEDDDTDINSASDSEHEVSFMVVDDEEPNFKWAKPSRLHATKARATERREKLDRDRAKRRAKASRADARKHRPSSPPIPFGFQTQAPPMPIPSNFASFPPPPPYTYSPFGYSAPPHATDPLPRATTAPATSSDPPPPKRKASDLDRTLRTPSPNSNSNDNTIKRTRAVSPRSVQRNLKPNQARHSANRKKRDERLKKQHATNFGGFDKMGGIREEDFVPSSQEQEQEPEWYYQHFQPQAGDQHNPQESQDSQNPHGFDYNYQNAFDSQDTQDTQPSQESSASSSSEREEDPDAARLAESRRKLAELEKDRPLWEAAAKERKARERAEEEKARREAQTRRENAAAEAKAKAMAEAEEAKERKRRAQTAQTLGSKANQKEASEAANLARRQRAYQRAQSKEKWSKGRWNDHRALDRYVTQCSTFDTFFPSSAEDSLVWDDIPWPVLLTPGFGYGDVTWETVEAFFSYLYATLRPDEYRKILAESVKRFHPDRWRARKLFTALSEQDRGCLEVVVNAVSQAVTGVSNKLKEEGEAEKIRSKQSRRC